jgi:hypothetical protein
MFDGLGDRRALSQPDRLLLSRIETESVELGPYTHVDYTKHPRMCRVRNLLGTETLKPLAEIRDRIYSYSHLYSFNWTYYAVDGIRGS